MAKLVFVGTEGGSKGGQARGGSVEEAGDSVGTGDVLELGKRWAQSDAVTGDRGYFGEREGVGTELGTEVLWQN